MTQVKIVLFLKQNMTNLLQK